MQNASFILSQVPFSYVQKASFNLEIGVKATKQRAMISISVSFTPTELCNTYNETQRMQLKCFSIGMHNRNIPQSAKQWL